jgi:FixJ family two-component response regulator
VSIDDESWRPKAPRQATVLVVDDEESVLSDTRQLLEAFRMTVVTAQSTAEALRIVALVKADVALIDWRLKDHEDGIALGRMLWREAGIPFVLFSGYLHTQATTVAMHQGAADVVDKPVRPGRLVEALHLALGRRAANGHHEPATIGPRDGSDSVSDRWARLVLTACRAAKDPKTEPLVAQAGCVSTSVFRDICHACDVGARDTRDLARFLRAQCRSKEDGSQLRSHLAIYDRRTRARLFERAGLSVGCRFVPLRTFLLNQAFVPATKKCLRELGHLAANDPLFFVEFAHGDRDAPAST